MSVTDVTDNIAQLQTEVEDLRRQLAEAQAEATAKAAALERFKTRVRETALKVSQEQGWCRPGMNGVLANDLELEPYSSEWKLTVRVTAYQDVEVTVDAETEDDAYDKANELDESYLMGLTSSYRWSYDEHETSDDAREVTA